MPPENPTKPSPNLEDRHGLSTALLTGLGGQDVASQIAAGRALKSQLAIGSRVANDQVSGTIVQLLRILIQVEELIHLKLRVCAVLPRPLADHE